MEISKELIVQKGDLISLNSGVFLVKEVFKNEKALIKRLASPQIVIVVEIKDSTLRISGWESYLNFVKL